MSGGEPKREKKEEENNIFLEYLTKCLEGRKCTEKSNSKYVRPLFRGNNVKSKISL